MVADFADAGDDSVFEAGGLLVFVEFVGVGGDAGEVEDVNGGHVGVHLFEGAGLDE